MIPPRPVFIATAVLLAAVSAVALGLKVSTLTFISSNEDNGLLPIFIWVGAARISIASSILQILASGLLIFYAWRYWPDSRRGCLPHPQIIIPIIITKLAILSFAALIWAFLVQNFSAIPDPGTKVPLTPDEISNFIGFGKIFDIENWACGLAKQGAEGFWQQRCVIEKAGRWVLVPQTVIGFVLLIVGSAGIAAAVKERDMWGEEREKMLRRR